MQKQETKEIKPGLKVTHTDARGKLIASTPYTLHIRSGTRYFEYPKMSGNLWYEHNGFFTEPAGRIVSGQIDQKAAHVEYVPPKSGAEKIVEENHILKQKADALERELNAIRKEQIANETAKKDLQNKAEKMVQDAVKTAAPQTKPTQKEL